MIALGSNPPGIPAWTQPYPFLLRVLDMAFLQTTHGVRHPLFLLVVPS